MHFIVRKIAPALPERLRIILLNPRNKELLGGSIIFFITKMIGIFLTYLFTWMVTHTIGAGRWGNFALCLTVINVFTIFSILGFDSVLMRYISDYFGKKEWGKLKDVYVKSILIVFPVSVLFALFILAFPEWTSITIFGNSALRPWMQTVAVGIPAFTLFQLNNATLGGVKSISYFGFFKNILPFFLTLVIFFIGEYTIFPMYLSRFQESGILVLVVYVVAIYIGALLNLIVTLKKINFIELVRKESMKMYILFKNAIPMLLTEFMVVLLTSIDIFMIAAMNEDGAHEPEVGLYDVAVKVSIVASIVQIAVSAISTPTFSQLYSQNKLVELRDFVRKTTKLIFWTSSPLSIMIIVFSSPILGMFGDEFTAATTTLCVLAIGQFVKACCGSVGNLLKMTDNQVTFQNILILGVIVNIALNYILIPVFSILGAAIASTTSIIIWLLIALYYANKNLNILSIYIPFVKKSA